jgi:hypothetical protein
LTENQKKYLLQQFNTLKIRRREPVELDVASEKPELIRHWINTVKKQKKLDTAGITRELHLNANDFIELYN